MDRVFDTVLILEIKILLGTDPEDPGGFIYYVIQNATVCVRIINIYSIISISSSCVINSI